MPHPLSRGHMHRGHPPNGLPSHPEERIHQVSAGEHGLLPNGRSQRVWGLCLDELLGEPARDSAPGPSTSFPLAGTGFRPTLPPNLSGCQGPLLPVPPSPSPARLPCGPSALGAALVWAGPCPSAHHHLGHQLGFPREVERASLCTAADGLAGHADTLDETQLQSRVLEGRWAAAGGQHRPPQRGCAPGRRP